jgi:hypothetical protein
VVWIYWVFACFLRLVPIQYELVFDTLRAEAEALASHFDAGSLDASSAADAVRELGVVLRLVQGMLGKAANRVHDTGGFLESGERDAAHFVALTVGVSTGEAQRAILAAHQLESLPTTDAAVRDGRLSARQAELIAKTATAHPGSEKRLLTAAKLGDKALHDACQRVRANNEDSEARSERQHETRKVRTWPDDDGMACGRWQLPPELGGAVQVVLDAEADRIFRERSCAGSREPREAYMADAFVNLVLGDGTNKGVKHTVHVVIDQAALVRGNTVDGERCEIPGVGPVHVEWVRSLLGSAFLTAVIKEGRDITTVAHLGRHVPAEVRTAMIVGGRECDVEGCECRGYLEIDHSEIDFRRRRADGVLEPHLAVLETPPKKVIRLDPRTAQPRHRQTTTPTTRRTIIRGVAARFRANEQGADPWPASTSPRTSASTMPTPRSISTSGRSAQNNDCDSPAKTVGSATPTLRSVTRRSC